MLRDAGRNRPNRPAKKRNRIAQRGCPIGLERLETRLLLSASLLDPMTRPIETIDWMGDQVEVVSGEWIVRFGEDTAAPAVDALGLTAEALKALASPQFGLLKAPGKTFDDLSAWAAAQHDVLYVEPNFVQTKLVTPNDPNFSQLWGMHNTGQSGGTADADIDAPEAWDLTTGSSNVIIAVIDSGADYTHPDLAANMWTNPGEIAGNFIDDDGNGFIDDTIGWDFAFDDNDPMDGDGHGTHVSGTIGAVGDNGTGVAGVNWDVTIMPVKFLDDTGSGTTSDAIDAINYVTMMKQAGHNIIATNNSWGGGGFSQALKDAIQLGGNEDVLFVAAAGNGGIDGIGDNNDLTPFYPSNYNLDSIISVASTDRNDNRSIFSNFGAVSVDLAAPGSSIRSTLPGNTYGLFNGTSMAAPHVTGTVALLKALDPSASALSIKNAILAGVDPIPAMSGISVTGGRLNAFNAMMTLGIPSVLSINPPSESTPVSQITIDFSDDIVASSVVPTNFLLSDNGDNNIFGDGDDTVFNFLPSDLSQPQASTVVIDLGVPLALEQYQLILLGTGANPIQNSTGAPLNNGADELYFFDIVTAPGPFESNDTLGEATDTGLTGEGSATFSAHVGDGLQQLLDVDLWALDVMGGATITADIDAQSIGSPLDPILRLFDANGTQLAMNDDTNGLDSFISFNIATTGTYYFGVSGWSNFTYDPHTPGTGTSQTTGNYDITITHGPAPGPQGSISGVVWYDNNGNGINELGETGVDKQLVYLDANQNGVLDSGSTIVASTNVPLAIPVAGSFGTTTSNLAVVGMPGPITDINVTLDIAHTWDGDLIVTLISPDGTNVALFSNVGSGGDDFSNTTLDDEGALPISLGSAPFAGTFRPEGLLSNFDGQDPNGTWVLQIDDVGFGDVGVLHDWSIDVSYAEPTDVTNTAGNYTFNGLTAGSHDVRFAPDAGWEQTHPADAHTVVLSPGQNVTTGADFGTRVRGDFNGDRIVWAEDIDQLLDEINFGSGDLSYDLSGNGALGLEDSSILVQDIIGTPLGDVNLDFIVGVGDLSIMAMNWSDAGDPLPTPLWTQGDVNGDNLVSIGDLALIAANWGQTGTGTDPTATRAAAAAQLDISTGTAATHLADRVVLPPRNAATTFAPDRMSPTSHWDHIAQTVSHHRDPFGRLLGATDTDESVDVLVDVTPVETRL